MSVLSSPQGTPERVWSLVAGLVALGGETDRETFDALLNPGYVKDGEQVRAKDTLAANALGAASSLGVVGPAFRASRFDEAVDIVFCQRERLSSVLTNA